jgi:hypothetical protein
MLDGLDGKLKERAGKKRKLGDPPLAILPGDAVSATPPGAVTATVTATLTPTAHLTIAGKRSTGIPSMKNMSGDLSIGTLVDPTKLSDSLKTEFATARKGSDDDPTMAMLKILPAAVAPASATAPGYGTSATMNTATATPATSMHTSATTATATPAVHAMHPMQPHLQSMQSLQSIQSQLTMNTMQSQLAMQPHMQSLQSIQPHIHSGVHSGAIATGTPLTATATAVHTQAIRQPHQVHPMDPKSMDEKDLASIHSAHSADCMPQMQHQHELLD